ncbi:hypothetical protein QO014_002772 [Kaistia dalseonensis]|uniref:Uncharacterized protein n=1 Tax=Kaistia dalseonensis TaxID=410840 RepID=A0ABU0H7U5_9HYPH|nr:hypothetical protein [Kaistia dalseonensis]
MSAGSFPLFPRKAGPVDDRFGATGRLSACVCGLHLRGPP